MTETNGDRCTDTSASRQINTERTTHVQLTDEQINYLNFFSSLRSFTNVYPRHATSADGTSRRHRTTSWSSSLSVLLSTTLTSSSRRFDLASSSTRSLLLQHRVQGSLAVSEDLNIGTRTKRRHQTTKKHHQQNDREPCCFARTTYFAAVAGCAAAVADVAVSFVDSTRPPHVFSASNFIGNGASSVVSFVSAVSFLKQHCFGSATYHRHTETTIVTRSCRQSSCRPFQTLSAPTRLRQPYEKIRDFCEHGVSNRIRYKAKQQRTSVS
jgi:hypothetical protein